MTTTTLRCHVCGGEMHEARSDMPFKLDVKRIVIIRDLPVHQCDQCGEHMFADAVMAKIETALGKAEPDAELEIVRYAA